MRTRSFLSCRSLTILTYFASFAHHVFGSQLILDVFYPESGISLQTGESNVFSIGFSESPYSYDLWKEANYLPWWGNLSYVISTSDKVGQDHWQKSINLGSYSGEVFVNIASYPGFLFASPGLDYTVKVCLQLVPLHDWTSGACMPRHSPYKALLLNASSTVVLPMYPSFGALSKGNSTVLIKQLHSNFFDNDRDIAVFIPPSLIENPISRVVNLLVLLDGFVETVSYLADNGGFDFSVQNGVATETLIVGVPPGLNGTACLRAGVQNIPEACAGIQRQYEYTPTECNPSVNNQCSDGDILTGGEPQFLSYVWDIVIPAVLNELSLGRGEVNIAGWSYGGLASCFATISRPADFQRAFCMTPSLWWNDGDIIPLVSSYANSLKLTPKAVVMEVGSAEDGYQALPSGIPSKRLSEYLSKLTDAFVRVGLGVATVSPGRGTGLSLASPSNLFYFIHNGGLHSLFSWSVVFQYGIGLLYQYDYPDITRSQRNDNMITQYPPSTKSAHSDEKNDCIVNDAGFIAMIFFLVIFSIGTVTFGYLFVVTRQARSPALSTRENELKRDSSNL